MPNWVGGFIPLALAAVYPAEIGLASDSWSQPPPRIVQMQYQAQATPVYVPAAAVVVALDWYQNLSAPVRDQPYEVVSDVQTFSVVVDNGDPAKWLRPWSEPTRRKAATSQQALAWSGFTPGGEVIYEDKWHQPWSEPTRRKATPASQQSLAWSGFTPAPSVAGWHQPWPTPAKRKLVQVDSNVFVVTQVDAYGWRQPWSEPVRKPGLRTAAQEDYFAPTFTPTGEVIYEDKWHQPWSEPVRKPGLRTAAQEDYFAPAFTPAAENIYEDKWHQPWSTPTRRKAQTPQQDSAWPPTPVEIIYEDKWHQPWSTPTRRKPGTPQQDLAWNSFTPSGEVIYEDKWHQPWSEPVRVKLGLRAGAQEDYFAPALPQPEVIYEDKWHQPWSEPTRRKTTPANQQALAWSGFTPAPQFTLDMWYQAWGEPVRVKLGLRASLQQPVAFVPRPIVSFGWFAELARPRVLVKPWVQGASQVQPVLTPIVVKYDWYQVLSRPTYRKPPVVWQQSSAFVPKPIVTEDQWHQPWSTPVRKPPPLRTAPFAADLPFTLPYAVVSFGWNVPQNDLAPRRKPGLEARYQQASAFYPYPIISLTTAVMAVTETPDTMDMEAFMYSPPASALVGIIELSTDSVPTAIVSIRQK